MIFQGICRLVNQVRPPPDSISTSRLCLSTPPKRSTLVEDPLQIAPSSCKTKPISKKAKMSVSFYSNKGYEDFGVCRPGKSKAKQTQSKPILGLAQKAEFCRMRKPRKTLSTYLVLISSDSSPANLGSSFSNAFCCSKAKAWSPTRTYALPRLKYAWA